MSTYSTAIYYNVDGIKNNTPWPTTLNNGYLHDAKFPGDPWNEPYLDTTKITMEIPVVVDPVTLISLGEEENNNYWNSSPAMQSKFSIGRTFSISHQMFDSSFEVYINGRKLLPTEYTVLDLQHFKIESGVSDGFLWVSYYALTQFFTFGNNVKVVSSKRIYSDNKLPMFSSSLIKRCRQVINNIESYYSLSPSIWMGGYNNDSLGSYSNIIPDETPVCSDHIVELQFAVKRIITYMNNFLDGPVAASLNSLKFTEVSSSSYLSIDHLNQIIYALFKIENEIITINGQEVEVI